MLSNLVPKTAEILLYSCFFKRININNRTHKMHNLPVTELRTYGKQLINRCFIDFAGYDCMNDLINTSLRARWGDVICAYRMELCFKNGYED